MSASSVARPALKSFSAIVVDENNDEEAEAVGSGCDATAPLLSNTGASRGEGGNEFLHQIPEDSTE